MDNLRKSIDNLDIKVKDLHTVPKDPIFSDHQLHLFQKVQELQQRDQNQKKESCSQREEIICLQKKVDELCSELSRKIIEALKLKDVSDAHEALKKSALLDLEVEKRKNLELTTALELATSVQKNPDPIVLYQDIDRLSTSSLTATCYQCKTQIDDFKILIPISNICPCLNNSKDLYQWLVSLKIFDNSLY